MRRIKNVLVCINTSKQEVVSAAFSIIKTLSEFGFHPIQKVCSEYTPRACSALNIRVMDNDKAFEAADFMLVVGGDGAMLRFAKEAAQAGIPMLGINMGKLGFMTELEPAELPMIKNVLTGNFTIDRRMMLEVSVIRNGKFVYQDDALNDATVSKGDIMRVIDLSIYSDNVHLLTYNGDGVVVCTPTGSTAYSMSAGGPIVEPTSENLTITPICPHVFNAKAFVLSPERTVTIKTGSLENKSAYLSVDGGECFRLYETDLVQIKRSNLETKLLRMHGRSFYQVLSQKLSDRK
ncbi:MAG: NAD(+)/NADH kinase [Clostridiales bacterium]|nr:NAD(+)/NADH kinase [Clostridiales bacterium]